LRLRNFDATIRSVIFWQINLYVSRYPLAEIRNTVAAQNGKNQPDALMGLAAQIPQQFYKRARVTVASRWANTDLVSGDERWLFSSISSSNGLRARHNGTDVRYESVASGTVMAQSPAVVVARNTPKLVTWDSVTGEVFFDNVSGG